MPKVAFETIGCRLNQYETENIASQLALNGFRRVHFDEAADLYIINTCTVTGRADASCRKAIAAAGRHDGEARIVVVGCMVSAEPDEVARLNGVDLVIDNRRKENIVVIINDKFPSLFERGEVQTMRDGISEFYQHNRAWVKIGDGCNQNCSYCVVPLVRGRLVNRKPTEIIAEINSLTAAGYEEIVLTGVHIGQYNYGDVSSISELLNILLEKTKISRIRLSSIEPQEISPGLIELMAANSDRICRHLHIPVQSGSDQILGMMHRPYTRSEYLRTAEVIRHSVDNVTIGADIIVGFPSESDDDFEKTVELAESGLIDYLHVFSYSDRRGTKASHLGDKVKASVIKTRNEKLREISRALYRRALDRQVGQTVGAISEQMAKKGDHYWGITDNYLKISIPLNSGGGKEIVKLEVASTTDTYLVGKPA